MKELEAKATAIVEDFKEERMKNRKKEDSYLNIQKTLMGGSLKKEDLPFWVEIAEKSSKRAFIEDNQGSGFTNSQLKGFYKAVKMEKLLLERV